MKRCPNCGYEGEYKRTNCPNCGHSAKTPEAKTPWGLRVLLASIVFPLAFVGNCAITWLFTYSKPELFYVVPSVGALAVCFICDKILVRLKLSKPVKPDNDIRFAPEEALFWSKSNEKEDKENTQ